MFYTSKDIEAQVHTLRQILSLAGSHSVSVKMGQSPLLAVKLDDIYRLATKTIKYANEYHKKEDIK